MRADGYHLGQHRGAPCAILYIGGKRKSRVTLGQIEREDAERWIREQNAKRLAQQLPNGGVRTVDDLFGLYLADRKDKAALYRMKQCREVIRPHFGALLPDEISKEICDKYIDLRRKLAVGDATIRTELTYLAVSLKFAVDTKLIASRPRIWRPPQARPRSAVEDYHLSKPQAERLIRGAESLPHLRLFIILALSTAGRPLHILQLEWERVDLHKRSINLDDPNRDRTAKGRARVPMNEQAKDALLEAKRHHAGSGYVIEFNAKPIKSIKKAMRELAQRTGIKVSPYVLRHTAAVWMAEAGVPMEEIAQYMGHTNPLITYKTYARFSPTHLQRAASALQIVRGSNGTDVPAKRNAERTNGFGAVSE